MAGRKRQAGVRVEVVDLGRFGESVTRTLNDLVHEGAAIAIDGRQVDRIANETALTEDRFGLGDLSFIGFTFEAMSALATVGASAGITPAPTTAGKPVLGAAMIAGRLGRLTLAYALQRQCPVRCRLPEDSVRGG